MVTLRGRGFTPDMDLACSFSPFAPSSVALYSSPETVTCLAPAHTQGLVGLSLSVNGVTVSVSDGDSDSIGASSSGVSGSGVSASGVSSSSTTTTTTTTLPFTYLDSPIMQGVYPQMGVVGGGATVMIYGQGWLSLTHSAQTVPTPTLTNSNQFSSSTYLFLYTLSYAYSLSFTSFTNLLLPPLTLTLSFSPLFASDTPSFSSRPQLLLPPLKWP